MIKILHTADVHLDSPLVSLAWRNEALSEKVKSATREAFVTLIDHALSETVAAFLIAGDLYDGAKRSAKTAAFLNAQLERLQIAGIPVFYIKGNHDAENPLTGDVALPANVHVFDGRGGKVKLDEHDIWIHGVSFSGKNAPDSLYKKIPDPVSNAINIALLHTSLAGSAAHDPYAPCTVAELSSMGFDYWALGHIHKRQVHSEAPWIVMPGIPQGRDIGEPGPKSATVISIEQEILSVEEIHSSAVEFLPLPIDVSSAHNEDDVRALIRRHCQDMTRAIESESGIVRVTLTGRTHLRWQLLRDIDVWQEYIQSVAEETDSLWIEKVRLDLQDPVDHRPSTGATDELGTLMSAIQLEDSFNTMTRREVESLIGQLPPGQKALLMSDESAIEKLCRSINSEGAEFMLAQMKGASE